jgi:hypothetical protein
MFRLPLELLLAVFTYLNFKQLLRASAACRQWQQIILDSSLWPVSAYMGSAPQSDTWDISWPDWTGKMKESFGCSSRATRQVPQTFSKGSVKSLSVIESSVAPKQLFGVLPNFLSLEKLSLHVESISSSELISILQSLPQITTFIKDIDKFQGRPMGRLKTIQLKLRRLSICADRHSALNSIMANIVQHAPDLVSLAVRETFARKELTMKLGDGIQCLALTVNKLPPISARGLKCLKLAVRGRFRPELVEQRLCNLSHLTHLQIDSLSVEEQLPIMETYNIGENLEFLCLRTEPNYNALLRTPKLKELRMNDLFPFPADVCPILQTVRYCGQERRPYELYPAHHLSMTESVREERKLALKSRGITVLRVDNGPHLLDGHLSVSAGAVFSLIADECYACGEKHT